jgi:hypothetical protein
VRRLRDRSETQVYPSLSERRSARVPRVASWVAHALLEPGGCLVRPECQHGRDQWDSIRSAEWK